MLVARKIGANEVFDNYYVWCKRALSGKIVARTLGTVYKPRSLHGNRKQKAQGGKPDAHEIKSVLRALYYILIGLHPKRGR